MNEEIKKKIREICTYYSELGEGTAGYDLSEKKFQKLFDLFGEEWEKAYDKGYKAGHESTVKDFEDNFELKPKY